MRQYLFLLQRILEEGEDVQDRTKTGTRRLFAERLEFDLTKGFPIVTTKKVAFHAVATELAWFLRGDTNIAYLHRHNVHIWDAWADEEGNLGPIYGAQWRSWDGKIDQLRDVVEEMKVNPSSRRFVVSSWNVGAMAEMKLPPCHILFQFYISQDQRLSLQVYQRSADIFLGIPFNISSYALLAHLVARQLGLGVGRLVFSLGDVHLYHNHIEQARIQLPREPFSLPELCLKKGDVFDFSPEDAILRGYKHHPVLRGEVAV